MNRIFWLFLLSLAWTATAEIIGTLSSEVLASGSGRVLLLSPKGEIVWSHPAGNIHDVQYLPNGNVLFADGNIHEVTRDHKEIFTYRPSIQEGGGAYSCQRFPNGNTVIGENGSGRIVELDPAGKPVVSFETIYRKDVGAHHHLRFVRKTDAGTYLVGHSLSNTAREYAADGKLLWEVKMPGLTFQASRLKNGNTMVSCLDRLVEVTPEKKIVWTFHAKEIPDAPLQNLTGFQVLPNGNIVIGCYAAYTKEGKGSGLIEITREKKCVWRYVSPNFRDRSMMGVQKLNPNAQ